MTLDWVAIGSAVGGFSTLAVAALTAVVIRENRLLRKAGNSPRVVAHFEPHPDGNGALQLVLSNVGTGPALDVSYSFEREPGDFENYKLLFKYGEERPALTMIGQGEKFCFTFAVGFDLFQPKDSSISRQLKPFHVKVSWRAVSTKNTKSEKFLLDVSAYAGLPGLLEKPPIARIADELSAIKKHLASLTPSLSASVPLLDATGLEQGTRIIVQGASPDSGSEQR